jgi:kynurenine formamidase
VAGKVPSAFADLAGEGRVFDLSQPISPAAPRLEPLMSPYSMCMWSHPSVSERFLRERFEATNGLGYADERVELDLHIGTHMDALGHVFVNGRGFGGIGVDAAVTNWGLAQLGIETVPPVVARGVLVDVPTEYGRPLEPGEPIDVDAIRQTLRGSGTRVESGDVVLIRTGWSRFYGTDNAMFTAAWPGITLPAAQWLAARGAVIVGADTVGLEVFPDTVPGVHAPVHGFLLAEAGVHILEQANLDPVSEAGIHEFLVLCLGLRWVGGTASPLRLTAIG